VNPEEEKGRPRWEGFAEMEGADSSFDRRGSEISPPGKRLGDRVLFCYLADLDARVESELSMGPFRVTQPNPIQLTIELTVW